MGYGAFYVIYLRASSQYVTPLPMTSGVLSGGGDFLPITVGPSYAKHQEPGSWISAISTLCAGAQ